MAVNFIYVRLEFECHHSSYGILFSVITVDLQDTMLIYYICPHSLLHARKIQCSVLLFSLACVQFLLDMLHF